MNVNIFKSLNNIIDDVVTNFNYYQELADDHSDFSEIPKQKVIGIIEDELSLLKALINKKAGDTQALIKYLRDTIYELLDSYDDHTFEIQDMKFFYIEGKIIGVRIAKFRDYDDNSDINKIPFTFILDDFLHDEVFVECLEDAFSHYNDDFDSIYENIFSAFRKALIEFIEKKGGENHV